MCDQKINSRATKSIRRDHCLGEPVFNDGNYVALLDGNVVAKSDNPDDAIAALRAIESNPQRGMVIDVCQQSFDVVR